MGERRKKSCGDYRWNADPRQSRLTHISFLHIMGHVADEFAAERNRASLPSFIHMSRTSTPAILADAGRAR